MTPSAESPRVSLMRERVEGGHHRVTYVELFFDLVFVFAITQVSHTLLEHFTPLGFLQVVNPVPGGVVGMDLHILDHQLARS